MDVIIIYFAIKYKGYFEDIYQAIKNKEVIPLEELENIKNSIENGTLKAITIIDEDYPEELKLINRPPFVLFYEGNKKLLKENKIILTGDFSNDYINNFVFEAIEQISKNYSLVSNYSKGLDEQIVSCFIRNKHNLILISPNGLNNPFFANKISQNEINLNNVLILSEYPSNSTLNKKRLIQRNRITMGLSTALIIASSKKESKILSLVNYALEQGKEVFCYPGLQEKEDGNNLLIQDGATMITSIKNNLEKI